MSASINTKYADCLSACRACLEDCKVCLWEMSTKKSMNDCPRCCIQCITVLQASIDLMLVDSQFAAEMCALCAKVCDYCADLCAEHDHEHCQRCAESCRKCAEACRAMA